LVTTLSFCTQTTPEVLVLGINTILFNPMPGELLYNRS